LVIINWFGFNEITDVTHSSYAPRNQCIRGNPEWAMLQVGDNHPGKQAARIISRFPHLRE